MLANRLAVRLQLRGTAERLQCLVKLIELDLALGQSRDCADVVWVELEHALAILRSRRTGPE